MKDKRKDKRKGKFRVASDVHQFEVVWKGQWFRLGSLSDHLREGVSPTGDKYVLYDRLSRKHLAPKSEVAIPPNPL